MTTQTEALKQRITDYLSNGGLFNPELANHVSIRDLLIECREALAQPERHELQAKGEHPAPCARFCEATAFRIAERGYQRQIKELQAKLAQPEQEPCLSPCGDIKCAAICKRHAEQPEQNADRFCDNNCVWTDHHPDCVRSNKPEPVGFVVDLYNGANTPSLPPTAMVAWLNDNPKIGQILYTAPPQPQSEARGLSQSKPLTDEQIYDMYNEPHSDAEMLEFARAIEAAHGIKE